MIDTRNEIGQAIGFQLDNWTGARPPETSAIQGAHCRIEPLQADAHFAGLNQAFVENANAADWTYLPYGPFTASEPFRDWLTQQQHSTDPLFHTIVDPEGRAVGLASYLRIEPKAGSIEIGHIHFSTSLQRTPAATESMYLLMKRAFDELGYRRYEWKCDALNERSRAAAKRLGFRFEGIFRQATVYKNRNRDTAWYSIIDSEWPAIRQNFESWLSSENFTATGAQISPLRQHN